MTLQELADAWNELHAAALGRGGASHVSAALATRLQAEREQFRDWLADQDAFDEIALRAWDSGELKGWVSKYNAVRELVQTQAPARALPPRFTPPTGAANALEDGLEGFGLGLSGGATAVAFAAVVGLSVLAFSKRGSR